jgi:hypothetical protein
MPSSLNCGSTGRPPAEYCLRHSLEKITSISEFSSPPFDIFLIETDSNNNNNCIICYYNNGGIICNECVLVNSEAGAGADDADDANDADDADADVLMNQIELNRCKYNNSSADTTDATATPTTTTTTTTTTTINY